jgi:hypothetical protein
MLWPGRLRAQAVGAAEHKPPLHRQRPILDLGKYTKVLE